MDNSKLDRTNNSQNLRILQAYFVTNLDMKYFFNILINFILDDFKSIKKYITLCPIYIFILNKEKMNKINQFILLSFFSVLLFACSNNSENATEENKGTEEKEAVVMTKGGIILTMVDNSPAFENAKLTITSPEGKVDGPNVKFSYTVENYDLASQTTDAEMKNCANSDKGQHIHLILNNEPYSAHYTAEFEKELEDGHYVALSFLSRSYHESLKTKGAYQLSQFTVGKAEGNDADLSKEQMFYSRPKGVYTGEDTKSVLLDFYLVNTNLSEEGNYVKATINDVAFKITRWAPYLIEGLPMGTNSIKLELMDADGKMVAGPFNKVDRTIILEEEDMEDFGAEEEKAVVTEEPAS